MPNYPAIRAFKERIKSCLMITNPNGYNETLARIDSELKRQAADDTDYNYFNSWWEGQRKYRELIEYLQYFENLSNDKFKIPNNMPPKKYYVENNIILDIPIDTLNLKEDEVLNNYSAQKILQSIPELITNNDSPMFIARSFGIGLLKMT